MTTRQHEPAETFDVSHIDPPAEDYTNGEGLRALLHRLNNASPGAWEQDPVAAALMEYAADKYTPLARKHGLDPWEAASAAFDVMRTKAARDADDPWAVVTHAVRITCIAEERAQGLLCSTHQARRPHISAFHDPERFSERDNQLTEYHPAFHHADRTDAADQIDAAEEPGTGPGAVIGPVSAAAAVEEAIDLFELLGWPEAAARSAVEHVCGALARAGTRHTAYESLRRDKHARALLDLPRASWSALLKALLGNPHPAYASTGTGRGVLLRLLLGETIPLLLGDDDLVLTVALAAPRRGPRLGPDRRADRGGRS